MAGTYADVFQEAWNDNVRIVFADSQWAQGPFEFGGTDQSTPQTCLVLIAAAGLMALFVIRGQWRITPARAPMATPQPAPTATPL